MPQNIKTKKYLKIALISLVIYCFLFAFIPASLAEGKDEEDCTKKYPTRSCVDTSTSKDDLTCETGLCHGPSYSDAKFLCCEKSTGENKCVANHPTDGACVKATACPEGQSEDKAADICPHGQKCCFKAAAAPNITLQVPIFEYKTATNITEYISKIFSYALVVLVPLAIVMIIYAGIRWITSGGNNAQIGQAKKIISNAIMGVIIGLLSYVILDLVGLTTLTPIAPEYIDPEEDPVTADGGGLSDYPADYSKTGTGNSRWDIELGKVYSTPEQRKDKKGQLVFNKDGTPNMIYKWHCPGILTTTVSCPKIGTSFKVNVKALQAFQTACNNLPAGLPKLVNGGSFNCRGNVNSPGKPSNHAYGIAFDIDPKKNQNCRASPITGKTGCKKCGTEAVAGCCGQDLVKKREIKALGNPVLLCTRAAEFGCSCNLPPAFIMSMIRSGFTWGGTYSETYDAMHFEVKR